MLHLDKTITKMLIKTVSLIIFLSVYYSDGAVLLWSNQKFEISPLNSFNDENLEELLPELGYPEVTVYKTSPSLLPEFKPFLKGYHTAFNPNGDISVENATEISGRDDFMELEMKRKQDVNVLSILVIPDGRSKREATFSSSTTEQPVPFKTPKGPVLYKGKRETEDGLIYGLLYSSKPLLLKTNSSSFLLGEPLGDNKVDTAKKDSYTYTRLNVIKIPVKEDNNEINLRFYFGWRAGYWTLTSVVMEDNHKKFLFDLNIKQEVTAPAHFSYHCSGETVFFYSNGSNTVELHVYDIQAQIDSTKEDFSDAYDCINFTSGPILSGLFVSTILGIGLIIGLVAISEIKTMDKFDNQKTKQLVITVTE